MVHNDAYLEFCLFAPETTRQRYEYGSFVSDRCYMPEFLDRLVNGHTAAEPYGHASGYGFLKISCGSIRYVVEPVESIIACGTRRRGNDDLMYVQCLGNGLCKIRELLRRKNGNTYQTYVAGLFQST